MHPRSRSPVRTFTFAALLAAACSQGAAPAAPPQSPAPAPAPKSAPAAPSWKPAAPVNVILIVIDTLRADAVFDAAGKYDTPSLDRLAAEGIPFPHTFSAAPMTLPSHMSLFSSRPPLETRVLSNFHQVPSDFPVVAEWLGKQGYESRAVISLATLNPLQPGQGPSRGFESYDYAYWDMSVAENTEARLCASLAQRDAKRPLFLFAHFSDPHEPYESHGTDQHQVEVRMDGEPLVELVTSDMNQWKHTLTLTGGRTMFEFNSLEKPPGQFRVRRFEVLDQGQPVPYTWEVGKEMDRLTKARISIDRGEKPDAECELKLWINDSPATDDDRRRRYGLEVAYVDRYVGQLLGELERLGLYQDSLIVFTSDHGEAQGEHKHYFGHVEYLTDEQIHVPLIVKLPAGDPRRAALEAAAKKLTTHLDVVPTLLDLAGLPPLPGQRGTSLLQPHESVHLAQTSKPEAKRNQIALRDERFKMIYFPDEERFELYDLAADPDELVNVFEQRFRERAGWPERLHKLYLQSQAAQEGAGEGDDAERDRMLRALGYGGGQD